MSWAKLDDRYDDGAKIRRAWYGHPRAVGLHAMAITYCARNETDGAIDESWLIEKLPAKRERDRVLSTLVDAGLFERGRDGAYMVHDYLEYNPSAQDAERTRDWDRKRKELFRDRDLVAAIRERDQDRCRYCGVLVNWKDRRSDAGGTYDHVEPRGDNSLANVVVACRRCNCAKDGRTPGRARMPLLDPGQIGPGPGSSSDLAPSQTGELALSGHPTRPDPTRPDSPLYPPASGGTAFPARPSSRRQRDVTAWKQQTVDWAAEHFPDGDAEHVAGVARFAAGRVDGELTPERLREFSAAAGDGMTITTGAAA